LTDGRRTYNGSVRDAQLEAPARPVADGHAIAQRTQGPRATFCRAGRHREPPAELTTIADEQVGTLGRTRS
jgi:hypothetical protein